MYRVGMVFLGYVIQFLISIGIAFYGNISWLIANLINIAFFKLMNAAAEKDGLIEVEKESD